MPTAVLDGGGPASACRSGFTADGISLSNRIPSRDPGQVSGLPVIHLFWAWQLQADPPVLNSNTGCARPSKEPDALLLTPATGRSQQKEARAESLRQPSPGL